MLRADGSLEFIATGRSARAVLWSTDPGLGSASNLRMQPDGNLVVYGLDGAPLWDSGTRGAGLHLEVRDAGELAVTDGVEDFWRRPEPLRLFRAPPRKGLTALLARRRGMGGRT